MPAPELGLQISHTGIKINTILVKKRLSQKTPTYYVSRGVNGNIDGIISKLWSSRKPRHFQDRMSP